MSKRNHPEKYQTPASSHFSPYKHQSAKPNEATYTVQGYHPGAKRPRKKRNQRPLYFIIIFLLASVFVFTGAKLTEYFIHSTRAKQEEQKIQQLIVQSQAETQPAASSEMLPSPTAVPENTSHQRDVAVSEQKPEELIQFVNALQMNPDTVGQLELGESIKTYVVQRDNSYYLRRSFSGEYSFSGTIFMDVSCSIYPQSRNIIIHGHNMQDGTAFGKLSRYDNIDYLNKYPLIHFSTLYESALYIPFAVVYYSTDRTSDQYLDIYQVNTKTTQDYLQFISKIQHMSEYHLPVNIAGSDHILTLTTCAKGDKDSRFAIFAVKSNTY